MSQSQHARLQETLRAVREALQLANDTPNGPINDTIWMPHGPETLFDFIDAALDAPQQPAVSAEPVACPYPCGWVELQRIIIEAGAYLARGLVEGEPLTEQQRTEVMRMIGYARDLCCMAAKPAPQPPVVSAEPVAWMNPENDHDVCVQDWGGWIPLYIAPQPSADAEIARLKSELNTMRSAFHNNMIRAFPEKTHDEVARAIDAAMQKGGAT